MLSGSLDCSTATAGSVASPTVRVRPVPAIPHSASMTSTGTTTSPPTHVAATTRHRCGGVPWKDPPTRSRRTTRLATRMPMSRPAIHSSSPIPVHRWAAADTPTPVSAEPTMTRPDPSAMASPTTAKAPATPRPTLSARLLPFTA